MFSLFNRTDAGDADHAFRRSILLALLGLTVFCGALFATLGFFNANGSLGAANLATICVALALMPVVSRTPHLLFWSVFYLLLFNSVIIYGMTSPTAPPSVFSWIGLIPIISLLLLGRRLGTVMVAVFLSVAVALYFWRYGSDPVNCSTPTLANLAGATVCVYAFSYVYEAARSRAEHTLRQKAGTDLLTGLGNRTSLADRFRRQKELFIRDGIPFCLLLIDIDHFKTVNDEYGHDIGDEALCWVAALITDEVDRDGYTFRYGGEEFCTLVANSDAKAGTEIAERIRARIDRESFDQEGEALKLSISIGVAAVEIGNDSLGDLISIADRRLYAAKRAGRNRVVAR